jgi:hypothetical protein
MYSNEQANFIAWAQWHTPSSGVDDAEARDLVVKCLVMPGSGALCAK